MRVRRVTRRVVRAIMPHLRHQSMRDFDGVIRLVGKTLTAEEQRIARIILGRDLARRARNIADAMTLARTEAELAEYRRRHGLNIESDPNA